jgi:hypothetical protein
MQEKQFIFDNLEKLSTYLYPIEINQIQIVQCVSNLFQENQTQDSFSFRLRVDYENEYNIKYSLKEKHEEKPKNVLKSLEYTSLFFSKMKRGSDYTSEELKDFDSIINYSGLSVDEINLDKIFNVFLPQSLVKKCQKILTQENEAKEDRKNEIINWLHEMKVDNYTINQDLTIDVNGSVNLERKSLESFPYAFGVIEGDFNCSYNELKSLKNSPQIIKGEFNCQSNRLQSLIGGPVSAKDYFCSYNNLTNLEGITSIVNGNVGCAHNRLKSLEGLKKVGKDLYCENNSFDLAALYPVNILGTIHCDEFSKLPLEYKNQKTTYYEDGVYSVPETKDIILGDAIKAYQKGMSISDYQVIELAKKEKTLLEKNINSPQSSHKIKL